MQSFRRSTGLVQSHAFRVSSNLTHFSSTRGLAIGSGSGFRSWDPNSLGPGCIGAAKVVGNPVSLSKVFQFRSLHGLTSQTHFGFTRCTSRNFCQCGAVVSHLPGRCMSTVPESAESTSSGQDGIPDVPPPRIKFKRLDKTARHIMQIVDREAVEQVKSEREIPDIRPGYIVQLKMVVPENKRRLSIIKGIVIARRNAGLNSTIRIRRQVAGIGVESLLPLYSPNIKEIKVVDKKKVRRAKLYYLRDKMNALKRN